MKKKGVDNKKGFGALFTDLSKTFGYVNTMSL